MWWAAGHFPILEDTVAEDELSVGEQLFGVDGFAALVGDLATIPPVVETPSYRTYALPELTKPCMDKHVPNFDSAGYMSRYINPESLLLAVSRALTAIENLEKNTGVEIDAVAFRGCSGMMIGPLISVMSNKTMLMVRKPSEKAHSYMPVEGDRGARRYIIVDDFVDTGETVLKIRDAVKKFAPHAHCLGVLEVTLLDTFICEEPTLRDSWDVWEKNQGQE